MSPSRPDSASSDDRPPVRRDRAWVEREYGAEKWPAVEAHLDGLLTGDEEISLSRAVAALSRAEYHRDFDPLDEQAAVFGGRTVGVPRAVALGGWRSLVVEGVIRACGERVDLVVELGSGWGRNLFDIWLAGGPTGARYVAAELTEAGRRVTERLAALDSRLTLDTLEFDFHSADLGRIAGVRSAVVFTAYAIHQIPRLSRDVFHEVGGIAQTVTCLHFEDFGWQTEGDGRKGSSAAYAERHDYNRDLVQSLREEADAGTIELESIQTEIVGVNPKAAASLAIWRTSGNRRGVGSSSGHQPDRLE